jgi:hypothetical protein
MPLENNDLAAALWDARKNPLVGTETGNSGTQSESNSEEGARRNSNEIQEIRWAFQCFLAGLSIARYKFF